MHLFAWAILKMLPVQEERSQKMQTLMSLNQTLAQQEAELAQYSDNDPRRFEMLSKLHLL